MDLTESNTTPVKFRTKSILAIDQPQRTHHGRLGLGTTSPSALLHVPGSNNFVSGAGGTTVQIESRQL
ncbi:hypothetical protein Plhal703r1_c12g0061241 [Plasmopara halstedii]